MEFRIADTFTDSLARLTGDEQKAVKTTAFDLQVNPAQPGMQFHKLDKARDPNFWSVRVSRDIRLIVHKTEASLLLCYVDHHDEAYRWAERRKLETHPKTGAAQLVEIRETVQEIVVPTYKEVAEQVSTKPRLFDHVADEEIAELRRAGRVACRCPSKPTKTRFLRWRIICPARPLKLCWNWLPAASHKWLNRAAQTADPFEHPDAQRRFRVMTNVEELAAALEYPWDKWTIFLHPAQRELVERDFNGPARVAGSAGTGKTIVALHRAVHLARHNRESRILLTTFSDTLSNALRAKLRRLLHHEPRLGENIEVYSINAIGRRLYELQFGAPNIASDKLLRAALAEAAKEIGGHKFSQHFLWTEWSEVVDAWQLDTWEAYRDVRRLGRKTRLPEQQRAVLWSIFDRVRSRLQADGSITYAGMFRRLAEQLANGKRTPFDFAVVDEAQDVNVAQLRFLAALGTGKPNSLFFAGDLGQRIFQQPFSWKALGVDIRGRSRTLHINYRTSHQIRTQADRLLGPELSDVDGITEERVGTISVFNGPAPEIRVLKSPDEESQTVSEWLRDRNNARRRASRNRRVRPLARRT